MRTFVRQSFARQAGVMSRRKVLCGMLVAVTGSAAANAQFTLQDSGTKASLRGIASPGNGVAWASGTGGIVLRTEDGGFVWQGCATPPGAETLDFRGVQAFDAQTALVMSSGKGNLSRVYKTTDGCRTWKLVFTNPDAEGFFDSLRSMTRTKLYLLGDPVRGGFSFWSSEDGGTNWLRSSAIGLSADANAQGAFAASNSSLMAYGLAFMMFGTGGKAGPFVYRRSSTFIMTTAPGATRKFHDTSQWTRMAVPLAYGKESAGVFSLAVNLLTGALVAVGGDYLQPERPDGSATYSIPDSAEWTRPETLPHGFRSSVVYDAPSKTWLTVGPNGTDISRDDGRNWSPLRPAKDDAPDADQHWNALALPFVVGPNGRIGRLRDGVLKPSAAAH